MARRKKPEAGFKPGVSGNPKGRPVGTGKPISRLRSTLNKLKLLEPDAIEVIEKAVKGQEMDKTRLDTSKWVITSISNLTRAALAEEAHKMDVVVIQEAKKKDAEEEKKEATSGNVINAAKRFSERIADFDSVTEEE